MTPSPLVVIVGDLAGSVHPSGRCRADRSCVFLELARNPGLEDFGGEEHVPLVTAGLVVLPEYLVTTNPLTLHSVPPSRDGKSNEVVGIDVEVADHFLVDVPVDTTVVAVFVGSRLIRSNETDLFVLFSHGHSRGG
jgi:hypothetical protein